MKVWRTLEGPIDIVLENVGREEAVIVLKDITTEKVEYSTGKNFEETNAAFNVRPEVDLAQQ